MGRDRIPLYSFIFRIPTLVVCGAVFVSACGRVGSRIGSQGLHPTIQKVRVLESSVVLTTAEVVSLTMAEVLMVVGVAAALVVVVTRDGRQAFMKVSQE